MLSRAMSRSKKPSALPDPNIRLDFGETAGRRSFLFVRIFVANVCFGPKRRFAASRMMSRIGGIAEVHGTAS